MSAEVLRQAATLMRERARGATSSPWSSGLTGIYGGGDQWYIAKWDDSSETPVVGDRMHIASWHPDVAVAVADWLEAEAASMEAMEIFGRVAATIEHEVDIRGAALTVRKDEKGGISLTADTSRPAVAVATAYLGTAS